MYTLNVRKKTKEDELSLIINQLQSINEKWHNYRDYLDELYLDIGKEKQEQLHAIKALITENIATHEALIDWGREILLLNDTDKFLSLAEKVINIFFKLAETGSKVSSILEKIDTDLPL